MADQQFMTLGTHCSEEYCRQLDFLPFKCPSCAAPFCSGHWRPPNGHKCAKYDPTKEDNRIPSCPLCSTPVSHPPTTSPDAAMDVHLSVTCPVLNPDAKTAFANPNAAKICAAGRCKTKLVAVNFTCDRCGGKFCAPHRYATDHACAGAKAGASGGGEVAAGGAGLKSLSGLAALRRAQASMKMTAKAPVSRAKTLAPATGERTTTSGAGSKNATATLPPIGTKGNPLVIGDSDDDVQVVAPKTSKTAGKSLSTATNGVLGSKTDRRAAAERASARKALEARVKKGLLSEKEKLEYATELALEAERKNTKQGEGCCMS